MSSSAAHPAPAHRLYRWIQSDRNDMLLVFLYAVASSIVALTIPVTVQAMVNTVAFGTVIQPVVVLAFLVFAGLATAALFRALQARLVETIQERLFARTALQLSHRLPRVDATAHEDAHGPELVNRFFDVVTIQKSGSTLLVDGSALALQTLVGMIVLAFYHPFLLAFDVLLVLAMLFVFLWLGRGAERTAIVESKAKYQTAAWLQEMMRHPLMFKGTGGERFAVSRTYELTQEYLTTRRAHFRVLFRQHVGALGFQVVFSSLLIAIGGILVMNKQLTLGQLVAAELIVSGVLAGFSKVGKQLESLYDMLAGFDKLGHLLELPQETGGKSTFLDRYTGPASVTVRDVTFAYPGRRLLEGASLELRAGERIALTGANGSGKSSLMNLFYGLRPPQSGVIEIDGEPIPTVSVKSLRTHVAMVRGIEIFEGTILENVIAGRPEVTPDDARIALEAVELWNEVKQFPQGVDTPLTSYGAGLSLGQARKLVIARAVVAKPRLLLLDESLDDLDARTRERVAGYLFARERPWTIVVTTHDTATLRYCTRTIVLQDGQLLDGGRP
ncbi:MAG: ABC transporter ATP-binding protein [Labilithrix sp.]|nr:ABC transporter ATP-binding protein [Labilithrix sp.]MCW5810880.1 ABC transporter ATP-binding protein [Labilithrix sp.]